MSGWKGMDEAIRDLEAADPARSVDRALERTAEAVAADMRQQWPVDTGASGRAWRSEGAAVVNPRPETSHIRNGLAARLVPRVAEEHTDTLERALVDEMGLG